MIYYSLQARIFSPSTIKLKGKSYNKLLNPNYLPFKNRSKQSQAEPSRERKLLIIPYLYILLGLSHI